MLRLVSHLLDEEPPWPHPPRCPLTRSRAWTCSCRALASSVALAIELLFAAEELAVALLEHVGTLVELLVALEQSALEVAQVGALGAALLVSLALEAYLLFLGLEDELLLLGSGLGQDALRPSPGGLDGLRRPGGHAQRNQGPARPRSPRQDDRHGRRGRSSVPPSESRTRGHPSGGHSGAPDAR